MPRYRVRLNDPNSEHFRVSYVTADTADEAVRIVQDIDQRIVATRYTEDELRAADEAGKGRAVRAVHDQVEPYELDYVVERGGAYRKPLYGDDK